MSDSKKTIISNSQTPLMKQYWEIKQKYPDTLLLFRVGDFYETFSQDAIKLSKITNITLTKRSNGSSSGIELAGFPYHALDNYIPKLIKAGCRVAVCNQVEQASTKSKSIIKREVTELVTPGLSFYDQVLEAKNNNYLASLHFGKKKIGMALLDLSTGEFLLTEGKAESIKKWLDSFSPSEVIVSRETKKVNLDIFSSFYHRKLDEWVYYFDSAYERLKRHFGTRSLKGFGVESLPEAITASGAILYYLDDNKQSHLSHIQSLSRLEESKYVWMDNFTRRNLELTKPQEEDGVCLLDILDHCVTPMGARKLKRWVVLPLCELSLIKERQNKVSYLISNQSHSNKIRDSLSRIGDLERLIAKVGAKRVNPREMLTLGCSLEEIQPIKDIIKNAGSTPLEPLLVNLDSCIALSKKIKKTICSSPPILINQGNLICDGVDSELDELFKIAEAGSKYLEELLEKLRESTGITSLRLGENRVFGYYLEVRHTHKDRVPDHWIRKQTLTQAERYINQELKDYEEKILTSREKSISLQQLLYHRLVDNAISFLQPIQQNAKILASLDCYTTFAKQAKEHNYIAPILDNSDSITLRKARHPVIEQRLPTNEHYVPSTIYLNSREQQILLITGPNMGGKSAVLRQTALIVLLAQMGSFIPAEYGKIGLIDKLFSRVGASDNLSQGESTFMVEMNETANILHHTTPKSLILLDELGRGTGTVDGLAIAQSVIEYLHNSDFSKNKNSSKNQKILRPKVLFATHYKELHGLSESLPRLKNYHMAVKKIKNQILFLYRLEAGRSKDSFGIEVARMAGLPASVINRASTLLSNLESSKEETSPLCELGGAELTQGRNTTDCCPSEVEKKIGKIDINNLTPFDALLMLKELKKLTE